jgi:hypothetical protein
MSPRRTRQAGSMLGLPKLKLILMIPWRPDFHYYDLTNPAFTALRTVEGKGNVSCRYEVIFFFYMPLLPRVLLLYSLTGRSAKPKAKVMY